jgi:hypothetical protein
MTSRVRNQVAPNNSFNRSGNSSDATRKTGWFSHFLHSSYSPSLLQPTIPRPQDAAQANDDPQRWEKECQNANSSSPDVRQGHEQGEN